MLNESKQLVMDNSRQATLRKNQTKQNGKEKCFICLGDTNPQNEKLIEESDCLSLYYNKKSKYMLFNSQHGSGHKNSNSSNHFESAQPNQNLIINMKNVQNPNLFSPCKCDKVAHMTCLTNYCIMNISFKCEKCNLNYVVEFSEKKSKLNYFKFIFLLIFFVLFHTGVFLILFLLFFGYFKFPKKVEILEIIVGSFFFLVNLFLMIFSYKILKKVFKRKNLKPKFLMNLESVKEKRKIDLKQGSNFYDFMKTSHKCSKMDLLEKKINNKIFLETVIKDKIKISEFIKENNNIYNIKRFKSNHNANEDVISLNKFNKTNIFSKRVSMRSNQNEDNETLRKQKSSQEKPKLLENNWNYHVEKEKTEISKSKTKNSQNVDKKNELNTNQSKIKGSEYKINIISEEAKNLMDETNKSNFVKSDQNLNKSNKQSNYSELEDEAEEKKVEKLSLNINSNIKKDRAHQKKISINQNLRMFDTGNIMTVENMLKKKIAVKNKTTNYNIIEENQFNENERINSASFLNVDDMI